MEFADRYGPWAVIAGASEGTGKEFARQIAAKGVRCVLVARRLEPLSALVEEIRSEIGVDCVAVTIDLSATDAATQLVAATGSREVGLFVANAGADPNGAKFLAREIGVTKALVQRNVMTVFECCHHFASRMQQRGRGGLLLVNSGACYGGASYMAAYSASKAFMLCFAESLWAELRPSGVDVLSLVMEATDTPAFRQLLAEKGMPSFPGLASPRDVAALGLARLAEGPIVNWGKEDDESGFSTMSARTRRERILKIDEMTKPIFGG